MASMTFIIERENEVVAAQMVAYQIAGAAQIEREFGDAPLTPQDVARIDCWGTLEVQLQVLQTKVGMALAQIKRLREESTLTKKM